MWENLLFDGTFLERSDATSSQYETLNLQMAVKEAVGLILRTLQSQPKGPFRLQKTSH